jgi:hypothetical protein
MQCTRLTDNLNKVSPLNASNWATFVLYNFNYFYHSYLLTKQLNDYIDYL